MRRFVVIAALLFGAGFEASAAGYRHKGIKEESNRAIYMKIAYFGIFSGTADSLEKLDIGVVEEPLNFYTLDGLATIQGSKLGLTTRKIGANAALVYRTSFFLRYEGKLDFSTASKEVDRPDADVFDTSTDTSFLVTTRMFSLIGTAYIDFNNPTFITPFVGFGYGVAGLSNFISMQIKGEFYQTGGTSIMRKIEGVMEYKAGLKFDNKDYYIDLEYIKRKVPGVGLELRGLNIGVAFRL